VPTPCSTTSGGPSPSTSIATTPAAYVRITAS
jgi:hypothetical protein